MEDFVVHAAVDNISSLVCRKRQRNQIAGALASLRLQSLVSSYAENIPQNSYLMLSLWFLLYIISLIHHKMS